MTAPVASPSGSSAKSKPVKPLPKPVRWIREVLAVAIWIGSFVQLWIMDIGGYIAETFPTLEFAVRYRFLVVLGTIALLWLLLRTRRFIAFVIYIVAYPFVVVFWHLPKLLFRNWAALIVFSPAIYATIRSFKVSFILTTVALISAVVICVTDYDPLRLAAMTVLGIYLMTHYVRRFRVAFAQSTVFSDVSVLIRKLWEAVRKQVSQNKPPSGIGREELEQKFGQDVLSIYVASTALHFIGEKVRGVAASRKLDLYFLASLLYTVLLTLIVFSLEYLGLERTLPGSFSGVPQPRLIDFLGLSFSTLMTADISPLRAASGIAQLALNGQLVTTLLIVILLVFVILTSIRERYKQDLDGVVAELRAASESAGAFIEANYELSLSATEALLLKINPTVTKMLLRIRHGEEIARQITADFDASKDKA